ncbi:hypothetical protein AAD018_018350 [Aestuariibius insulae]|uniref:hypothetical protein n=1 Tax=Aestuariibius insulae TaxID=2058287 RepID=UPI00345E6A3A
MVAGTAGGTIGGVVGGLIGGGVGALLGPGGAFIGRAIGSRLGQMAGRAAAAALQDHTSAMESAEEEAEEIDETEGEAAEDEECKECAQRCQDAAGRVKDALYRNKRSPENGGGGNHGYMNRMIEQMCGRSGPGTDSWDNHVDELVGAQNGLRREFRPFSGDSPSCDPQEHFSRAERQAIDNILNGKENGWTPNSIPWKGPGHPDCQGLPAAREGGRLRDYLEIIRPPQGNAGAPLV